MTIGIQSATSGSANVSRQFANLYKTSSQLSSGSKITQPSDDAAGLAVSMKLSAELSRMEADRTNLSNSQSFLQTQDGALQQASSIMERIAELKTRSSDITLNSSDRENYNTEFKQLQEQLSSIQDGRFNDQPLFADGKSELKLSTSEAGEITLDQADLAGGTADISSAASLDDITSDQLSQSIENVATLRATNGAQSSQLSAANDLVNQRAINTAQAYSRISDTDYAEASTRYASQGIRLEASIAIQAYNQVSQQAALRLLG